VWKRKGVYECRWQRGAREREEYVREMGRRMSGRCMGVNKREQKSGYGRSRKESKKG
jgi:hypothetical protein